MKVRVVLSALVLVFSLPALAATASVTKTDHAKKHHATTMQTHSAKGMSESKHRRQWYHKARKTSKSRHHNPAHKMTKKHASKKAVAGGGKKHPKK